MSRQSLMASIAALALLLGVSACGGDDDKADPKPTKTTASASPRPTTSAQPEGADGVTYRIQNWDEHSDDPVVLAYKTTNEAYTASINQRKVLPAFRRGVANGFLRKVVGDMKFVKKKGWHLPDEVIVKVRTVRTTGTQAVLTMCVWRPSNSYYDKKNKVVGPTERWWDREITRLSQSGGRWILTKVDIKGKCPGGAPA